MENYNSNPSITSDPNKTTFVQADSSSFKHVVQMLTGSADAPAPRKDKLYQRRNTLNISPLPPPFSASPEILSPSILDFPSLALSPVTPLIPDPFNRGDSNLDTVAEDKAIKEKGFYFHPSPANTPRDSQPRLLPLFPVTSPRVAASSDS